MADIRLAVFSLGWHQNPRPEIQGRDGVLALDFSRLLTWVPRFQVLESSTAENLCHVYKIMTYKLMIERLTYVWNEARWLHDLPRSIGGTFKNVDGGGGVVKILKHDFFCFVQRFPNEHFWLSTGHFQEYHPLSNWKFRLSSWGNDSRKDDAWGDAWFRWIPTCRE